MFGCALINKDGVPKKKKVSWSMWTGQTVRLALEWCSAGLNCSAACYKNLWYCWIYSIIKKHTAWNHFWPGFDLSLICTFEQYCQDKSTVTLFRNAVILYNFLPLHKAQGSKSPFFFNSVSQTAQWGQKYSSCTEEGCWLPICLAPANSARVNHEVSDPSSLVIVLPGQIGSRWS